MGSHCVKIKLTLVRICKSLENCVEKFSEKYVGNLEDHERVCERSMIFSEQNSMVIRKCLVVDKQKYIKTQKTLSQLPYGLDSNQPIQHLSTDLLFS